MCLVLTWIWSTVAVENILFSRDEYGGLSGNEDAGCLFLEFGNKKKIWGEGKKDNEMYPLDFEAFYLFSLLLRSSAVPSFLG